MAKNKDDEFNFEWDDDSSFDSKLDNFDGDVSEYHSDDIKSAEKDRNPVAAKLKSITPTINAAGSAVIAGAGKGIGRAIEDDMPEVYQAYQQGTHILSEARIARQEISDKFRPWWNDTKRAVRRLSQQLEGQMPFGLDKKILKLVGEEDRDQQYKQPSKESLRQEQMNSNISQIFELQMQKSMEQQKDAVLNRTYDRRVDAIRHKESAGFLAKIAESSVFHQAFTNSVFTAYLKKDLELKYKQFYATEDILGVMTNHAKAVDTKLDAVIKNTALPEADKIYMGERIIGRAKENIANKFNDKLNNYFGKMRENLVNKFKDAIDWAELIPEMFNMQAEMLETVNDEDMQGFGGSSGFGEDSVFTKKGLMKLGFGKIGDFFGRRILRKLTSKLPQETMESLKYYFGGGQNGLALLVDDLARGRLKGLPSGLRDILRSIAPRLNDTTQTVVNESWQTLHNGGKITNKFIQAVEEVIPGYLKMQTRYLEILATGRDSGLLEWDPRKHAFRTQQELLDDFTRSMSINDNDKNKIRNADIRIQKGTADTTQLIQHVADSYGSNKVVIKDKLLKAQRTSARDIELFKVNLAHSEDYWRIDESILSDLNTIANAKSDSEIQKTSLWKADMFKGIKSPVNVAGFWLDILADRTRDGLVPNKIAIDHLNAIIVKERIEYSGRYRAMLEQRIKDTGQYFLLDKFSKQDSSGNYIVDESAILRQQMNTTSSNNELMQKLTPEQLKFYNQTFLDIKEEEKNKKNWFGKWVKGLKEKLSKFDLTEFTDDIFKGGFISVYKKFNGENSDEAAEKKWKEILKDVDEVKKFFVNNYEKLSSEVKRAWDKFKIKTFDEALTVLGEKVDSSFHNLRNKLMYIDDDGETKLRDISDLTEEEWYDWFISIQNIESVLETFDGKSALSQVLRSVLPDHIQALLIAARNDKNLIKNMRLTANQYSGTDAESVNKRMQINKEAARKAIAKANKAITARMTSRIGSTTKSNMSDDDYKALSEANIKMHKDEYSQMIKVDTDKLNENSQIDISKEQLKMLRNIDNQLGLFYRAFIDTKFRNSELAIFDKGRGKIEGDNTEYMRVIGVQSLLRTINDKNTSESQRDYAIKELEKYGFTSVHQAEEWLNSRNDTLKDTRSRLDYQRYYNTGAIDIDTGAILLSNTELDNLTSDEALKKNYGKNISINDELRYHERYNAQRKMLRKHYMQLLKNHYVKDNSNNPIYTYFATLIIDAEKENRLLDNINATISGEAVYNAVIYFILNADTDDSRISLIKYLKLLLVRDRTLTSAIRKEDRRIDVIQEFLPIDSGDILKYALNCAKDVEAHGITSANAIITNTNNAVNIKINNSSYDAILAMRANKEKELDELNKEIADIYSGEDDVYISEEDRRKRDELLISRDAAKVGLNTINTAIQNFENLNIKHVSKNKTGVYADDHSSFISRLIRKNNLNYSGAIKYIENIGRSQLRRQNTDNKLISIAQYTDIQTVIDAVDAIKTNFSTEEDIIKNGPETLKRMLTGIYQYIKHTNKTPNDKDIEDIYHAITHTASSNNKRKYASGESYDLNEHMQLDNAAVKYIEKVMSKPGGPTATEFKKIQKLHAEALRRFVTRNPNMRNIAAEQYLNNGIPVLQWDTSKLGGLSPYDQQVGKMLFGDFYKRGNRYLNAGGRAHGTSVKGKNANAVIELGYDTPVNFDTLFTLDHESRHILDKRAQPGMYNLSKYAGREHIGVGAPWEHYANLGAIKSQIERGNVDQLIKMMQYLNKTANDNTNDNRYLAKQIRRMLHKAGVDTSAYSPTRKYAKGGNIALAYSRQLVEDKKLDDELRKKYKYGKYFDEKYSSADLIRIRSSLSPQEQQIFDAECADFNNSWLPRFINRLKPFRSSRWEKHTSGIPVIDANKINQNIEFSPWDREYIDTLLNTLATSPAAADPLSKLIWAKSDKQNKLPKGVLFHEASHVLDSESLPTQNMDPTSAHSGKGARFEKRADWNAIKRLLASGDIKGVRGYINWLQRLAKKIDPNNMSDLRWRANLLIKAAKHYGYDLNQGLKYKKYASGESYTTNEIQNYLNVYNEISRNASGRDKDNAINSLIETTLTGKDYENLNDLDDEIDWATNANELRDAIINAKWCEKLEYLLQTAPILDKTDYYRQWLDIPSTVHVAAIHIKEDKIKQYYPNLDRIFWEVLADAKSIFSSTCAIKDPRHKDSGYIIRRLTPLDKQYKEIELFSIAHELGHIVTERGTVYGVGGDRAHQGRGHYTEKHADIYGLKRYIADVKPTDINHIADWLAWSASSSGGADFAESKSNGSDGRWRADLIRRYMRMGKYKGNPLFANFNDEDLQSKFRNKYAKGDNISFDLPIDQYGGYVDQPTEILGGTGIAGEAGGETILPHKFNERFKELIYRCLRDTVGENIARRVLGMLNPSETTEDKLGILLSDNEKVKFASGGSTAATNANVQTDTNTTNKKEEYTRQHPTDTIKNILLNIMESNEAIYSKLGDGLLVVDLASALDKFKNSELMNKLKGLKISERIKNFIFGTDDEHKGLIGNVLGLGKRIAFGAVNNAASFGRHLVLGSKVCDVFLKSDIEGQVHGDKKISAAELENGTIFSDAKCTKPIYSVADIYPPVYRKKIDENGKTIVEEAITEEEAKPGLVDVDGNPLTYFGGKVGRFLHNIAMKPINAIFSKSALEKVSNIGSSISSGIRHGFDGFFGAYCDVYSARNPEKMLVSGTSIKEGRLVRIPKEGAEPKVVPTVFDIDSECWIMIDDPNDATKRILGDKVIYAEDITAGLQHRDGTPIESSKLSLAMSKLRRLAGTVGGALATLTGGAFGIAGKSIQFVWEHGAKAAGWLKDRVVDAFTSKDPYIDVCIVKDGKLEVVITGEDLKTNKATMKYCFRDDKGSYKPVLSAYGIDSPVYTMVGADGKTLEQPKCVIKKEDIENGVFDTNGNKLTRWAGRSLAGKISAAALGAVKFGWRAIKGIGKGIWNVGATVVGKLGSLLGEGGAAVTGIITNAWNSTLDLFRNTIVSRRDLQEIVGDRLLDIYGLLYKYMPRKKYDPNDKDGDGDVDGSWADYEQKRKEREAKREQERLNQWYKDHPNAERNDDNVSFLSKLKNAFFSGFGNKDGESSSGFLDWVLGALGIKSFFPGKGAAATTAAGAGKAGWLKRLFSPIAKLFAKPHIVDGKLESGKLYKFGKGIKEFFTGNKLTGKTGIIDKAKDKLASAGNWFKGLFGKKGAAETAEEFHARVAAQRAATRQAILASSTSRAAAGATSAASKSVFTKLLGSLGPKVAARVAAIASSNAAPIIGQIASIGMTIWSVYEIGKWLITDSPKTKNMRSIRCKGYGVNSKYWEAIIDLETDTFEEFLDGNTNGVDRDRLTKFGYKVDFLDLSNPDSEKLEFLTTWYRKRFMPAYNFYLGCMRTVGVEFKDDPPKDDNIPDEKYPVFVTEFTKHIDKFSNGPTKILRLDNNAYTAWLANKHEKERDEGLLSSKYNDNNLADKSISKLIDNPLDNLAYAWNEFRHGNVLNSLWFAGKAVVYAPAYAYAKTVDVVWKNITSYFNIVLHGDQRSNNEKAWDEVRFKLYGLNKDDVSKEEYSRITKVIKDFEINQIHVIDGEQQVLDDELKDLARELFPAKIRQEVKNRLMLTNDFTDNVSDDLSSEARSFVFSWYKRIFVPIFTAYARVVRAACGDKPGDNISIDSIPEENRLPLLKEFERQSNRFLATNIDTEILRLSSKGFYDFLVMRSDEDKAELAKDTQGLLTEEETTFSDKLSRNLNKAGKNFSDAWNALVKEKNVVKAVDRTLKGIGNTVIGVFKSIGTSIGESIADFLHGSKNEHAWEERFIDYGFMDREGSSDIFTNSNISAMNEFEKEAGRILLEDNTSKPDDKFFISIAFNCKYIEKCCASLFGVALNSLAGAHQAMFAMMTGKLSLSMVKTTLINEITSKLAEDKNKEQQVKDVSQKISDMLNYLDFWYTFRFKPVFGTFINVVSQYGVDAANVDVDDIPTESRKEALEQYRKMVSSVLKKNNIRRYSLSPEGLAIYLDELYAYREDIKDGKVDNKYNPLAAYYKEKEETYKNEVINAVVANAFGLSKEDKSHVANSLAKASTEIDTELNDVSLMATISAKDALKDLGIDSLIDINYNRAEATIVGKLMELTTGYNNYDKLGVGSGFIWDDKLGKVFTDFMENAHKYLYKGGSAEDLHEALTEFMNIYLKSKVFSPGSTQDVNTLDSIMANNYPYVAASNATFKYFANWFSHRFIPYYTYYVTLVNKANKVDDKDEPALGKLTSTHRRYVLMKLMGAEKKNLIPNKAKSLKLTQQDMDNFYKRENAIAEQRTQTGARKRQSRAVLQQQVDEIRKRYEEKRDKAYTESNNTESSRTETNNLSTIKAVDGVATGATVGGRYARNKGTSLSTKDRQYVWDFLISQLGLTEPQAAAVMGNMMQESGLSCDVVNGIGATGICQWLGNRLYGGNGYVGLIPFAKANGLDYMSVEAQMKYLQWELTHNKYERDRFDAFVRSVPTDQDNIDKTIAQCAVGFRKGYERCGENEANDTKRISYAKAIYNTFSSDKAIPKYTNYNESNVESMQGNDSSVEETSFPSYIKQYSNSVVPSTTPSDRTMGVSGGNSSVPSHIARYGNISEMTAKACKSLTVNSREKSVGRCARYVANALQAAGYKFNRQPSAYMYHTNGILSGMGFECIGRNNPQPQPGDVCVINRFNGHPHGHICMFNGQQWISDFRQRTPVPYKAGAPGGLWYYRPSGNTSADSNGEFITNSESASSSQDSIVTSTYNSTKANDALVYSNAVDTIRDSLPSENAEQTPSYTYTNMTGEGDNKHILTQNAMQSSIAGANNGSAPIVAELQLISKILSEFRGDVVGFINTLLTGTSSSGKTEQPRSIGLNNNKPGSITANNVDENTIKEIGDKLLTYVSDIISSTTKSSIAASRQHTSNTLANTYPLSSSKTR